MKADIHKITETVTEIKDLYKKFLSTNGNSSLRVSNKEFNLWIVKELLGQNGRIGKLEAKLNLLYLLTTAIIAGVSIKILGGI